MLRTVSLSNRISQTVMSTVVFLTCASRDTINEALNAP
jgi:hypothetical protein